MKPHLLQTWIPPVETEAHKTVTAIWYVPGMVITRAKHLGILAARVQRMIDKAEDPEHAAEMLMDQPDSAALSPIKENPEARQIIAEDKTGLGQWMDNFIMP